MFPAISLRSTAIKNTVYATKDKFLIPSDVIYSLTLILWLRKLQKTSRVIRGPAESGYNTDMPNRCESCLIGAFVLDPELLFTPFPMVIYKLFMFTAKQ